MPDFKWSAVRLPGVQKPSMNGPYRFILTAGRAPDNLRRAAFDGPVRISKAGLLQFALYSPTSRAMRPHIIQGDFGYPTISLKNERGTVFSFARGNIKDFFDITRVNQRQIVQIPVSAFDFNKDLKTNVVSPLPFFDSPIAGITFDFLAHPEADIDIFLDEIRYVDSTSPAFVVQDLVVFERLGQARQLPLFSSEAEALSFGVALSSTGLALDLSGCELAFTLFRGELSVQKTSVVLSQESRSLTIKLPHVGAFTLAAAISRGGQLIAHSQWPVCRLIARRPGRETLLGISDEYEYDRIAAVGGSWDRLPILLQTAVPAPDGLRFAAGTNPLPVTLPGPGRSRTVAAFAMPKWLSRQPERADFYRYGPTDWSKFADLVRWLATAARRAGVTHYEVWNEASALGHWSDDMATLIELHRVSYETVKAVDPAMQVLGGCTHSWTFDFLRAFAEAGGGQHCDGLSVHGYTYQPEDYKDQFDQLDAITRHCANGRDSFKAYVTEIGFRYPAFSLENQAKFLVLYTLEAASRGNIGAMLWFRFTNPRQEILSGYRQNSSTGYALVGHGGSYCRPALAAYRWTERLLQHFDIVAEGPANDRLYHLRINGTPRALARFRPSGGPMPTAAGWRLFDACGTPLETPTDLTFAIAPDALGLMS